MLAPPSYPCCEIGSDKHHPYTGTPPHTVILDPGFRFGLCDFHYTALVLGFQHARRPEARPVPRGGYAHRRYARG